MLLEFNSPNSKLFFYCHTKEVMVEAYSILFQKTVEGAKVKDLLTEWKMVCTDFPFELYPETKELPKRDWMDEDGEDTFIPDVLPLKAYDLEAGICYTGEMATAYNKIVSFLNYLIGEDGNGATLKVYNPHTNIGRQKLYFLGASDYDFHSTENGDVVSFKVKFRVTDPKTAIVPSYSIDMTTVLALVEKKG